MFLGGLYQHSHRAQGELPAGTATGCHNGRGHPADGSRSAAPSAVVRVCRVLSQTGPGGPAAVQGTRPAHSTGGADTGHQEEGNLPSSPIFYILGTCRAAGLT